MPAAVPSDAHTLYREPRLPVVKNSLPAAVPMILALPPQGSGQRSPSGTARPLAASATQTSWSSATVSSPPFDALVTKATWLPNAVSW